MRPNNSAGCFNIFLASFSRIILIMFWLSRPVAWNAVFGGSFILPCLGFIFLPFTTLVYAWLVGNGGGIQGFDWIWLILAVFIDVATVASAGYTNRNSIPGMSSSDTTAA